MNGRVGWRALDSGHGTRIHAYTVRRVRVTGHIYLFARTHAPRAVMSTEEAAREDDAGAQVVPAPNDAIHHDGQPRMMHEAALCGKFFSIHGCAYGDDCHFSHVYYPGMLLPPPPAPLPYAYAMGGPQSAGNEKMKTRLCRNFNSPEGCRFGDRCVFAHGEEELRSEETNIALAETTMAMGNMGGFMMPHYGTSGRARRATSKTNTTHISDLPCYGTTTTDTNMFCVILTEHSILVPVHPTHVGIIVGKAGSNLAKVSSLSGAKVSLLGAEHVNPDGNRLLRIAGSPFDVQRAQQLIYSRLSSITMRSKVGGHTRDHRNGKEGGQPKAFKTKMCASWEATGTCSFGENCHFAHGKEEIQSVNQRNTNGTSNANPEAEVDEP